MGVNVGKWVYAIIGFVVICLIFPLVLTGISSITGHASIADFTGLQELANITPLLMWIGIIGAIGFLGFTAARSYMGRRKAKARKRG